VGGLLLLPVDGLRPGFVLAQVDDQGGLWLGFIAELLACSQEASARSSRGWTISVLARAKILALSSFELLPMSSVESPVVYLNPVARYSDAAIHGGVVYLAGQVPSDATADMAGQTTQVLDQIGALLIEAGSHRGRILMAQVIVKDIADVPAMNGVWDAWFQGVTAPPRATFQGALVDPAWKIEVVVTAALA
jgi:enamine deaminase RidA (YjgF/YER057c/UK114 family)